MMFLYAFLIGGLICALAQVMMEYLKFTPAHATTLFVAVGALLEFFDIYDKLVKHFQAGVLVPISNYGHLVAHEAVIGAREDGLMGILKGLMSGTSAAVAFAVLMAVLMSIIFKPKG